MARINIVNADNKIDATPQRAYFKLKQTGGPKGEKGDTGAQGPQGATGPQGASASVVVNSTTTLPAGSDATVENIGTPQNVKLNFGIPTGPQGPQGEQGPQGVQGPQGLKGDTGAKGADGAAAKVTVGNTNTGAAGTNAIVENTGSDTFAVLNFTIPRGDKGETGPMPDIAQTTGQATDEVMSQKATTDALATKQNTLTAGTGITIASDTVSADTTVLATKEDLNDYAPQATTYTKTETDTLLAPKLEADVVASLPATGEEGKLYLTPKNYTRQTATGNPITATISDGAGTLEAFKLDGDTEQQTYTGKNLVKPVTTSTITASYNAVTGEYSVSKATSATWPWLTGFCTLSQTITSGTTITISRNVGSSFNFWVRTYHPDNTYGSYNLGTSTLSQVITEDKDIDRIVIMANAIPDNFSYSFKLQVELGNEATSFEPYVGGTPAPNPDFPQAVQTVTGEQNIVVTGKNLFNVATAINNHWLNSQNGKLINDSNPNVISDFIEVISGTTYTISGADSFYIDVWQYTAKDENTGTSRIVMQGNQSHTFTPNTPWIRFAVGSGDAISIKNQIMLELGSTATTYAPYHATTYPLNLGATELCKLGAYQDYIWKDGSDWKVHKATMELDLNNAAWTIETAGSSYGKRYRSTTTVSTIYAIDSTSDVATMDCTHYTVGNMNSTWSGGGQNIALHTNKSIYVYDKNYSGESTTTAFTAWLDGAKPKLYYPLATSTDTTITDSTLIAQLEAIRTAALENGTNTIANSAAGSNLAGDMEIGYYSYNPRNRYDKWLWLDINDEYEQIGS